MADRYRRPKFDFRHSAPLRALRAEVFFRDAFTCQHCGWAATISDERALSYDGSCTVCGHGNYLTLDHIIPLSRGGEPRNPDNLQTLCHRCNARKGVRVGVDSF